MINEDDSLVITSKENSHYKDLKKVTNKKSNYILIEGKKLLQEAIKSLVKIEKIYIDEKNESFLSSLLPSREKPEINLMSNSLIANLFTTENKPEGDDLVLALGRRPNWMLSDLVKTNDRGKKKNIICSRYKIYFNEG